MTDPPSVAIVGAGCVGQALGRLLVLGGYDVTQVVARRAARARAAARFIGSGAASSIDQLTLIDADVVIVAVPDDAIAAVARRLADVRSDYTSTVVLHTSGARDGSELESLRALGANVGSMHPLQSFPTPALGVERMAGSVVAIEGDRVALRTARRLGRALGGKIVRVRSGAKALYHAAAVLASGGVTSVVDVSLAAMRAAGLSDADARSAVLPLVQGTVANIAREGTDLALTGPFARGDRGTIERNEAALDRFDRDAAEIYRALGKRARAIAQRRT